MLNIFGTNPPRVKGDLASYGQLVARAAHGAQVLREARVVLEVAAQAHDEVVDRARLGVRAHVPDLLQDLAPCRPRVPRSAPAASAAWPPAGSAGRSRRRAGSRSSGSPPPPSPIARGLRRVAVAARPVPPAQQALDPRQQHRQVEGLGQVVVGARLEPCTTSSGRLFAVSIRMGVKLPALRMPLAPPRSRRGPGSMTSRIDEVEGAARPARSEPLQRLGAVADDLHLVALQLEVELDALGEVAPRPRRSAR